MLLIPPRLLLVHYRRGLTSATSPPPRRWPPLSKLPKRIITYDNTTRKMMRDSQGREISSGGDEVTAGIIVIGDEILKGQTQDTNTFFLAQKLHSLGIKLRQVSVVSDDVQVIARAVKEFSGRYTVVLTSGGIGPTHDDVTFEGVALAFDDVTETNSKILGLLKEWFKTDDPGAPALKLACIPSKAKLNFGVDKRTGKEIRFPIVSLGNVFVFPGIPDLLRRTFSSSLGDELFGSLTKRRFYVRECFVSEVETSIADRLNALVETFPDVKFGSYPEWSHNYFQTKITVEADSEQLASEVERRVREVMPTMSYDKNPCENAFGKINQLLADSNDESFKVVLSEAMSSIEKCFRDYRPEEVIVCFNGGKDCIVMLHLAHAYFSKEFPGKKLQAIYIEDPDPFPEVEKFILETEAAYQLEALNYQGPMKQALQKMLQERPSIKATILGTRMGDPGSHSQGLFSPTDGDWPKMMRVNPVLNWEYGHVWTFIRGLSLPYPSLYDNGYTSLGSVANTSKNEALRYVDENGVEHYKPAYKLQNGAKERAGRK